MNEATLNGGCVAANEAVLQWSGGIISGNSAGQDGGGIYTYQTSAPGAPTTFTNMDIESNAAAAIVNGGTGGGFFATHSLSGSNVDFETNTPNDGYLWGNGGYTFGAAADFTCEIASGCK